MNGGEVREGFPFFIAAIEIPRLNENTYFVVSIDWVQHREISNPESAETMILDLTRD
jgi:hypothetical protein